MMERFLRSSSILFFLFLVFSSHPSLAELKEAPNVLHPSLREKKPPEIPPPFKAPRFPFLPSLTKNHEPKLCSIVLKRARQRFFSPGIEISPPIDKEDGAEWIPWNVFQEVLFDRRVDLDLDGNGRLHPVIGKKFYGPGIMVDTRYRVFKSAKALENKIAAADGNPDNLFEKSFRLHHLGEMKIFRWKNRSYFFDYESDNPYSQLNILSVAVSQLKGDGTVPLRCKIRFSPDIPINPDLRAIPGFKSFLKVLSTIGKEDNYRYAHHDGEANAAVDRASYRPWAVSRATLDPEALGGSYHRYDERMKSFLQDWSLLEVWNRREYQTFLHHVDPAVVALTRYYVDAFGITREEANRAAQGVIEELIAAWIQVPSSYDPEQDLYNIRRPLLNHPLFNRDRASLEEILRKERERSTGDSKEMDRQLTRSEPSAPFSFDRKPPDLEISLALHDAVEWGDGMRLLLSAGADPNTANEFGKTPLMTATHMNRLDTARLLLSHGANPNMKTGKLKYDEFSLPIERTALMYAAENAGTPVMKLLLEAGAFPDERDSKGNGIEAYLARNPRLTDAEKKMGIRELVRSREDKSAKQDLDCSKARTSVDKAVCGDEILNMFDGEMAIAYRRWKRLAGYEATKDQRRWLKERDASCVGKDKQSDIGCLQDQTRSRVRYLHNRLAEHGPETNKP